MKHRLDVLSVGDGNLDVWMRVPHHTSGRAGSLRESGIVGDACRIGPGGAAANVAIGMARLGARTAFVGAVGDDPPGAQLADNMREHGVDVSHLHVMAGQATSVACMFETPDREYDFYVCPGPRSIPTHRLPADFVRSARMLYVTGHVLTEDGSTCDTLLNAMATARDAGVTVALDPGKYWLNPSLESRMREALNLADIVLPNRMEAEQLTGRRAPHDAAADLLQAGIGLVAVTMGDGGCLLACAGRTIERPAFRTGIVSTVGAGDAFASGMLYSYLEKDSLEEMADFANAAAAIKIGTPGASEGMPGADAVRSFLRENA